MNNKEAWPSKADILHIADPVSFSSALNVCSPTVSQLNIRGVAELLDDSFIGKRVGIIGTRDATTAGLNDARRIAQVVCQYGGVVVSGMATGIDGAAHRGVLDVNGQTIAVLGSGVDVIYPTRHTKMYREILERGCVISEFDDGTSALPWHFPVRNRIIAALSDIVVVPEGTLKGGARITVDLALAMGKCVCALPGPRRNRSSELCNAIIRDGAVCINDPADVLSELGNSVDTVGWDLVQLGHSENIERQPCGFGQQHEKVLAELAQSPHSAIDIAHLCTLTENRARQLLSELESSGLTRHRRGLYEIA